MLLDNPSLHIHTFGGPATVQGVPVVGIFRRPSADDLGMQGNSPSLELVTSELPTGTVFGVDVVVGGDAYTVGKRHDDGAGVTILYLREA